MYPDTGDLVELLVAVYGESRSVNMIETVLKEEIGRADLVDKVSMLCSTSTGKNLKSFLFVINMMSLINQMSPFSQTLTESQAFGSCTTVMITLTDEIWIFTFICICFKMKYLSLMQDIWTKLEPEVKKMDTDGKLTYRCKEQH